MRAARLGAVGRADVLRALAAQEGRGREALGVSEIGALLGYEFDVRPVVTLATDPPRNGAAKGDAPMPSRASEGVARGVPFWQPRRLVWRADPAREVAVEHVEERKADARERERAEMAKRPPPAAPLLSSRRRLMPMVERALVGGLPGDDVDVDELVRRMGCGRPVVEIPRLRRRGWPALVVLIDRDFALAPFWPDQRALCKWLLQIVGRSALVVRVVDERGPEHRLFGRRGKAVLPREGALCGVPVLALTDLGWYRGIEHQRAWLRLGRRLRRAGERIHALVPVPPSRWTRALARVWTPMAWERPSPKDGAVGDPKIAVRRLLAMAAFAHRLEPGLLRALRLSLPGGGADVGTEADAWLHEDMDGSFPAATVVRAERAQALRRELSTNDAARVRDALQRWHWHRERRPELWYSEALALEQAVPGIVDRAQHERAEAFVERLGAQVRTSAGSTLPMGVREWLEYVEQRAPKQLWDTATRVGVGLQRAWWATHGDGEPPPFADPALRAEIRGEPGGGARRIDLWQVGGRVGSGPPPEGVGSLVASITAVDEHGHMVNADGASREISVEAPVWFEGRPEGNIELRTDQMTLRLEALQRPEWASAIGRDQFGLWAELRVEDARYRMRWIAPGRFVMGSPEAEPGRRASEGPQHEVMITKGFWLGETPVTQALWQAVTGENPSYFKSPDRPVETVSWRECQTELIVYLNERFTEDCGERFRLPTEAEWEYACRAGTSTATYAGPSEILGENDAPVLDDIAWYGGNSGVRFDLENGLDSSDWPNKQHPHVRAGTRRVGKKQPNSWGLYDLLGNVWEWCLDGWRRRYSGEVQRDPMVPAAASKYRVIRGGSWRAYASYIRAAARIRDEPDLRNRYLGLRLARGQAWE